MASAGLLQIGAGLGYMRPSPLLRSERKRKQITLAANLQQHQDKLIKVRTSPNLPQLSLLISIATIISIAPHDNTNLFFVDTPASSCQAKKVQR